MAIYLGNNLQTGGISAYDYAVSQGYTGTAAEFAADLKAVDGIEDRLKTYVEEQVAEAGPGDLADSTSNEAIGTSTNITTERDVYYGLVTVNGASQTRATGIYAPTAVGTSGYVLRSNGSGAPSWVDPAVIVDPVLEAIENGSY